MKPIYEHLWLFVISAHFFFRPFPKVCMDMLVDIIVYDSTSTVNIKEKSLITEGLFLNNSKR